MNEPLAKSAGNALEVKVAVDHLTGAHRDARLHEVVIALGAEMLIAGGLAANLRNARATIESALDSGAAAEKFAAMVRALGGPGDLIERAEAHLSRAPCISDVEAPRAGHVSAIDARALGLAVVALGGGRTVSGAAIDPAVGLTELAGIGDEVGPNRPLCRIHARRESDAEAASAVVQRAYIVSAKPPGSRPAIIGRIAAAQQ